MSADPIESTLLNIPMTEEEGRAKLRGVLGIAGEAEVCNETHARKRLELLAALNASNACLRRYRIEHGPNAYAVLQAMLELSRGPAPAAKGRRAGTG